MAGNVFGLNEVYDLQKDNATDLDLNIPGLGYGYAGQGYSAPGGSSTSCLLNRIEFSTETITASPNQLTTKTDDGGGWSSENYGYFIGGYDASVPGYNCKITRLDFSNDTTSQPGRNLNEAKGAGSTVQTKDYGYYTGGGISGGHACSINRMDFSSETTTTISAGTNGKRLNCSDVQSSRYGYICGGIPVGVPNAELCTVDRLDFSVETISVNAGSLDFITQRAAGNLQDQDYGYVAGGSGGPPPTRSRLERVDFTTDAVTLMSEGLPALPAGVSWSSGVNSPDFGYWLGGQTSPAGPGATSVVNRLDFSTQTTSSPGGNMTAAGTWSNGGQVNANRAQVFKYVPGNNVWKESPNHGYFCGGYSTTNINTMDRIDFSSETTSAPGNNLIQAGNAAGGIQNTNYAYLGGGQGNGNWSTISRLEFQTDTIVNSPAKLNYTAGASAGISAKDKGYFAGNASSTPCAVDRLDFATETVTANTPIGRSKREPSGAQSDNHGYCVGGSPSTNIDRVDFATDIFTTILPSLTQGRRNMASVQNTKYAYFCLGGGSGVCTVDRMDFSTETVTEAASFGPARWYPGGASSFSYGYIAGGYDTTVPANVSIINRLDFDTETASTSSSTLNLAKRLAPGVSGGISTRRVGGATYGYFGSGIDSGVLCTIDRLEFSTETISAPGTYQVTQARRNLAATSSSFYGYFGGGYIPPNVHQCTIDRLDFSNETVSANPGQLTQARGLLSATSSSSYGYFGGGNAPPAVCTIDRLDFSSETVSNPPASLTQRRYSFTATSSNSYSYFAGGYDPNTFVCTIDRLDLSTETTSNPPASLTQAREALTATSSSSYGYFGGGSSGGSSFCTIDRIDFSNETVSANPGQLTQARSQLAATSSSFYGYFGGGSGGSDSTIIDRLDFAAETVSLPSQNLTQARRGLAAVSNG